MYQVVKAGNHEVSCTTEVKSAIPFEARAKEAYHIEAEVQWGLLVGRPKLIMVPADMGKLAIQGTKRCNRRESVRP